MYKNNFKKNSAKLLINFSLLLVILLLIKVDFRLEAEIFCCGDDHDYYSHAETLVEDFDFDYQNQLKGFEDSRYSNNGKIAPIGFFGSGLLASPFLFVGNIFDKFLTTNDQLSYKVLFYSFSAIFYVILTLNYLMKIKEMMNSTLSRKYVLLLYLGSGVSYYAFERFSMTHVYEVFTITMISYFVIKIQKENFKIDLKKNIILLTFFIFLGFNVRWVNYFIFVLPVFLPTYLDINYIKIYKEKIFLFGILFFALLTIQINKLIYGIYTLNPTKVYSSDVLNSSLLEFNLLESFTVYSSSFIKILFSQEFGIFYFSPILFFGFLFLIKNMLMNMKNFPNYLGLAIYAQVFFIVLIWQSTASSYGFRYLFNLVPVSIIIVLNEHNRYKSDKYSVVFNLIFLLSIFSFISTLFFETTELTQLSLENKLNTFGKSVPYTQPQYLKGYLLSLVSLIAYLKIFVTSYLGLFFFKLTFSFISIDNFINFVDSFNLNLNDEKIVSLLTKYSNLDFSYVLINLFLVIFIYKYLEKLIIREE